MPGSIKRASGMPFGSSGSSITFSTPIHIDWMNLSFCSCAKVPLGCVATSATSMSQPFTSGQAKKRSFGRAWVRSGNQNSGFSFVEANRTFTVVPFLLLRGLDPRRLDDRAPLVVVGAHDLAELRRAVAGRLEAHLLHALRDVGCVHGLDRRLGVAVDHV